MDVRHHVVAEPALQLGGAAEVDVVEVGTHGRQRAVRNVEAQLALRLGCDMHDLFHRTPSVKCSARL